jgi:hypothetical protein
LKTLKVAERALDAKDVYSLGILLSDSRQSPSKPPKHRLPEVLVMLIYSVLRKK